MDTQLQDHALHFFRKASCETQANLGIMNSALNSCTKNLGTKHLSSEFKSSEQLALSCIEFTTIRSANVFKAIFDYKKKKMLLFHLIIILLFLYRLIFVDKDCS